MKGRNAEEVDMWTYLEQLQLQGRLPQGGEAGRDGRDGMDSICVKRNFWCKAGPVKLCRIDREAFKKKYPKYADNIEAGEDFKTTLLRSLAESDFTSDFSVISSR